MKTIRISDEMHEALMEISKQLNDQDHRATAMPYFFQVMTEEEVPVPDGFGESVWVMDGEICLRSDDDIKVAIYEYKEWDKSNSQHGKLFNQMSDYEKEEILRKVGYRNYDITTTRKYENCFFTEKACETHIRQNRHNLNKPKSYLNHAFRNPEMELVLKFLCELSGGKMHK